MTRISTKAEIAEIYLKHQKTLFTVALTYVESMDIAQELVADAIVAILEQSPCFTSEASCVCYLKQIVRNKAISRLCKKYRIEVFEESDIEKIVIDLNNYDRPYQDIEIQLLLHELLKEYPKQIREAFISHVIDQESIPVLAEFYGLKTDTLRKQIGRMKTRIAATISEKDMKNFLFVLLLLS